MGTAAIDPYDDDGESKIQSPNSITFDEIEAMGAAPVEPVVPAAPAASPLDQKLEGDAVPEELRGRTMADLVQMYKGQERSLNALIDRIPQQPQVVQHVPQPAAEPEMSQEQFNELLQSDPAKAWQYGFAKMQQVLSNHVDQRVTPLYSGQSSSAQRAAESRHPDMFKDFGKEISAAAAKLHPSTLANPATWDDIVTYVKGQNIDKLIEARIRTDREASQAAARDAAPVNLSSGSRTPAQAVASSAQLSPAEKRAARVMGISEADYLKHRQ